MFMPGSHATLTSLSKPGSCPAYTTSLPLMFVLSRRIHTFTLTADPGATAIFATLKRSGYAALRFVDVGRNFQLIPLAVCRPCSAVFGVRGEGKGAFEKPIPTSSNCSGSRYFSA